MALKFPCLDPQNTFWFNSLRLRVNLCFLPHCTYCSTELPHHSTADCYLHMFKPLVQKMKTVIAQCNDKKATL